jgi:hypothetical protein
MKSRGVGDLRDVDLFALVGSVEGRQRRVGGGRASLGRSVRRQDGRVETPSVYSVERLKEFSPSRLGHLLRKMRYRRSEWVEFMLVEARKPLNRVADRQRLWEVLDQLALRVAAEHPLVLNMLDNEGVADLLNGSGKKSGGSKPDGALPSPFVEAMNRKALG